MISRLASFKSYFQQGLAARLLIAIVLFSSLITLIITATQLFFDYRHDVYQIESRLQQIENVHLESIENALYKIAWRQDLGGIGRGRQGQYFFLFAAAKVHGPAKRSQSLI